MIEFTDTEILDFVIESMADKHFEPLVLQACEAACKASIAAGDPERVAVRNGFSVALRMLRGRQ